MTIAATLAIDAIAARLAPVTLSGGRVFTDRAWPIDLAELPAWRVMAEDESVERQYVGNAVNQHELTVACEGIVRAVSQLDDSMHALAAAGMTAIFAEPVPYELQLTSIDRRMSSEGDAAVGLITVRLTARYAVNQAAPTVIV